MKKKRYFAPDMELMILEQSDIITTSGGMPNPGGGVSGGAGGEEDPFGNVGGAFGGDWK